MEIRDLCEGLLGDDDLENSHELFDKDGDAERHSDWIDLLVKFNPNDEDIGSSNYEGQSNLHEDNVTTTCEVN